MNIFIEIESERRKTTNTDDYVIHNRNVDRKSKMFRIARLCVRLHSQLITLHLSLSH